MADCSAPPRSRRSILIAAGIIVAAAAAAYCNSFSGPFVFDDAMAIAGNPSIRNLNNLASVLSPPANLTLGGRPIVNLTFAISRALGGGDLWGYHALNLAIHTLAGLAFFGIVRRLMGRAARTDTDGHGRTRTVIAAAVALLWVVHPLQTESVTYLVQRTESLMGMFFLLTVYCFVRGASIYHERHEDLQRAEGVGLQSAIGMGRGAKGMGRFSTMDSAESSAQPSADSPLPDAHGPMPQDSGGVTTASSTTAGNLWLVLSVLACLVGMGCKEVMVSAPVMVLLVDRTFFAGSLREAWNRRRGYYLALGATWIPLAWLAVHTGSRGGTAGFGAGVPWTAYAATQLWAIPHYLALAAWPHPLALDYGTGLVTDSAKVFPGAVIVGFLAGATAIALWRRSWLGVAGAWFFAILAPTSSFLPVASQTVAEHRMYLPLAAVIAVVVIGAWSLLPARRLGIAVLAIAAVALGITTARRNFDYRSELGIWKDTAAKRPGNVRAHFTLGNLLLREGRAEEAMNEYAEALRLEPRHAEAHNGLGNALVRLGRVDEAIAEYGRAAALEPEFVEARYNLGNALAQSGRPQEAIAWYREALRIDPGNAEAHNNLAGALLFSGRIDEAIREYREAVRLRPDYREAIENLRRVGG